MRDLLKVDLMVVLYQFIDNKSHTLTEIQHNTKITYSHISKIKNILLKKELIIIESVKQGKFLSLTNKGWNAAIAVKEYFKALEINPTEDVKTLIQEPITDDVDELVLEDIDESKGVDINVNNKRNWN